MKLDPERYINAVKTYESLWRATDEALYSVCRKHPKHDELGGVVAKVYLVGRSYATQIERHVMTDGTQGGSLMKVIRHLHEHAHVVDQLIHELHAITEPLTAENLSVIASVHGRFVGIISRVTRDGIATPSFASKYLHFHSPVVPIYDSIAVTQLGRQTRWNRSMIDFDVPVNADADYSRYLCRLWGLYKQVEQLQMPLSVKYLDFYALSLAVPTIRAGTPVRPAEGEL